MSIALPEGQPENGAITPANQPPKRTVGSIAMQNGFTVMPTTMGEAWGLVERIAMSALVPDALRGKPADIFMAISLGSSVGLDWAQSMQGIAVIGKRAALWGDHMLAVVQGSPAYESVKEWYEGSGETLTAFCTAKRRGDPEPATESFSVADARTAGLWSKQGPWTQYPKRMLKMRARAFALRDKFADVLKGIGMVEEVRDIPPEPRDVTPASSAESTTKAAALKAKLAATIAQVESADIATDPAAATETLVDDTPPQRVVAQPAAPVPEVFRNAIDSVAAELRISPSVAADVERVTLNGQPMTAKLSEKVIRALRDVAEGSR